MSNTLTIHFPTTSPTPVNGYQISYWPTSNPSNIQTVTVFSSPAIITGLTEYEYAGSVKALCRGDFSSNTLTIPTSNPVCQLVATVSNVVLPSNTDGTNGQADISVSGGSGGYSIVWANTGDIDFSITNLTVGDNPFTVTDNNTDCYVTGNVHMSHTTFVCPLVLTIEQTAPTNSTGSNGTATVVFDVPGTGTVTYLWTNGQTTATATGLYTGVVYTCTVTWTDSGTGNHCVEYISTTPIAPSTFVCNLSATFTTTASCISTATGTATITVAGGTGPWKYSWSNGQITTTSSSSNTATGLVAGATYSCFVTDLANTVVPCSKSFTVTIPTITCNLITDSGGFTTTPDNVAGNNGTATMPVIRRAVAPVTYSWNTVPTQTTQTATGLLENTTYICVATDARGCTISFDFEIPAGTCTESACQTNCCTYLLENTAQDTGFTYYDCEGSYHNAESYNALSATFCSNKDYGAITPTAPSHWWTLTLLGCCTSPCVNFTLYPSTFPYSSTTFRYLPCYSDTVTTLTLVAGDEPVTICVNMKYGVRKVTGDGSYIMGNSCIPDQGGVVIEHIFNSNSLVVNQITGIYGFTILNPVTFGNTYTGSHPFGLTSGSITINVSGYAHGDTVTIYRNGNPSDIVFPETALINGDNIFTGITYDATDNLFFIFQNNL